MATAHFNSPKEAIEGTARLLLAEGYSVKPEIAAATVASAFNVVVQMFGDTTRGIIKLDSITDIQIDGAQITYNDILKWTPYGDDYKKGVWKNINYAGERLINRVKRFGVSDEKLRKAGLIPKKGWQHAHNIYISHLHCDDLHIISHIFPTTTTTASCNDYVAYGVGKEASKHLEDSQLDRPIWLLGIYAGCGVVGLIFGFAYFHTVPAGILCGLLAFFIPEQFVNQRLLAKKQQTH